MSKWVIVWWGSTRFADVRDRRASRYRRWQITRVTRVRRTRKRCFKMVFSNGVEIVASHDHQWLAGPSKPGTRGWDWRTTSHLVPVSGHGMRRDGSSTWVMQPAPTPDEIEYTHTTGWLGGFFDGEGSIHVGPGTRIVGAQRPGVVQDRLEAALTECGFDFTVKRRAPRPSPRAPGAAQPSCTTLIRGGQREMLRLLMSARPERLIETWTKRCSRTSIHGRQHSAAQLVEMHPVGEAGSRSDRDGHPHVHSGGPRIP